MSAWFDSIENLMISSCVAQVKIKKVLDGLLEQNSEFADKYEFFIQNFDKLFGQLNAVIFDNIKEFYLKKE